MSAGPVRRARQRRTPKFSRISYPAHDSRKFICKFRRILLRL